jgi:hypothetical protein
VIEPSQCTIGRAVWYEPSPGVKFIGTISSEPRKLGEDWVCAVNMATNAYGLWRLAGQPGYPRMSVPAAALFALSF